MPHPIQVSPSSSQHQRLPFFSSQISAGFPSPADDHTDQTINLTELLVSHPSATFIVKAAGESMVEAGITSGDLLIVDRSLTAQPGDIVIAYYENEFLVKRLIKKNNSWFLQAENKNFAYRPLPVTEDVILWGVVSGVVRIIKRP